MIKKVFIILSFILITSCGFKIVKVSEMNNFTVKEINYSGDKRSGFKIKNILKLNSKNNSKKEIIINLDIKKNKSVKEKNIKNEITKYQIAMSASADILDLKSNKINNINVNSTGNYLVSKNNADTLNSEKKTTEILTEDLAEKILKKIKFLINDI